MGQLKQRIKTKYTGVFYRESITNGKADKTFYIVYRDQGKVKERKVGKFSEGMRVERANAIRISIINSIRLGSDAPDILNQAQKKIVTFDEVAMQYFTTKELLNKTNSQAKNKYHSQLKPHIGHKDLHTISKKDILHIQIEMAKSKAPKTVNQYIQFIRTVFYFAIEEELYTGKNPAKGVKEQKVDNRRERFLTVDEVKLLLQTVKKDHQLYLFTLLSLSTGARAGGILSITKKDVEISNSILKIKDSKNNSTYTGFFKGDLQIILANKIKDLNMNDPIITLPPRTLRRKMKKVLDTLFNQGLEKDDRKNRVVIHTLRHTFASQLAINGTPIYTIQKLLNHKDIKQTQRYAKLAPDSGVTMVQSMMEDYLD